MVTPDGNLVGWVGGAECAHSIAVDEALAAIEAGEPTLVGLAPDPATVDRPGLTAYPMTCHSGGTLELYIDPVVPQPQLVVVGDSPVAMTLAGRAAETGYAVTVVTEEPVDHSFEAGAVVGRDAIETAVTGAAAVVVASMGAYDEAGVAAAIRESVPYLGLVASDPRREEVVSAVADLLDLPAETVAAAVTTPAGVDIGAETPAEIAVSVLAELIAVRRDVTDSTAMPSVTSPATGTAEASATTTFEDPVCGMTVTPAEAAATRIVDGDTVYFCSESCAAAYEADPDERPH